METLDEDQRQLRSNAVEDEINAVQTRSRAKNFKEVKPLNVPGAINIDNVGPAQLEESQKDTNLMSAWELKKSGEDKNTGKQNTFQYFTKRGILFQKFKSPKHQWPSYQSASSATEISQNHHEIGT